MIFITSKCLCNKTDPDCGITESSEPMWPNPNFSTYPREMFYYHWKTIDYCTDLSVSLSLVMQPNFWLVTQYLFR